MKRAANSIVDMLATAYRGSRQRVPTCSPAVAQTLAAASRHAIGRVPERELAIAAKCYRACVAARRAAECGDTSEACRSLAIADALAARPELSEEARLLCQAETCPAEAFVELQYGDSKKARWYVNRSLATDQELEDRFGHHMKISHRLYMTTVFASSWFWEDQVVRGVESIATSLSLFHGQPAMPEHEGDWSQTRLDRLPEGMREFHSMQAIEVLYSFLPTLEPFVRRSAISALLRRLACSRSLSGQSRATASDSAGSLQFLQLLETSLGDDTDYLHEVVAALQSGGSPRMMLLVAFGALCRLMESGFDGELVRSLAQELKLDGRHLLPSLRLQSRLDGRIASRLDAGAAISFAGQVQSEFLAIGV